MTCDIELKLKLKQVALNSITPSDRNVTFNFKGPRVRLIAFVSLFVTVCFETKFDT